MFFKSNEAQVTFGNAECHPPLTARGVLEVNSAECYFLVGSNILQRGMLYAIRGNILHCRMQRAGSNGALKHSALQNVTTRLRVTFGAAEC